ncbi:MAG: hypothetical protein KKC29_00755 [Alphaproteobacteria bacterium]|jgi:hypothetical protein|nr:hypothetical protein [Alphaproteobacteria bacterium]MBU2040763.1 hypothetical protein [Alphaproteobacteria bacterium]MBU2125164.1 hypothetical protein [Alphaproteobacteria bacterium]MBU2289615.1 hypothetical protein [Alphaproteobacteria bacterium]MBU2396015.1 hypothetical protein [Alphaproteobacteria bacterium]
MPRLSHILIASAATAVVFAATPVLAQSYSVPGSFTPNGHVEAYGIEARASSNLGLDSTTPTRIASSRREMNYGRRGGDRGFREEMNASETLEYAERVVRRGGFSCSVVDAAVVTRSTAFAPFVEVYCDEGGGIVVSDTEPLQWVDCLDIPAEGYEIGHNNVLGRCRLPGNTASMTPAQSDPARN